MMMTTKDICFLQGRGKMEDKCERCWWKPICKKTNKACYLVQEIDMRWNDSPNNGNKSTAQNNTAFTDISKLHVKPTAQNG